MLGSMLISGKRTGQVRLDLSNTLAAGVPTNPGATFEDVLFDAQQKLDEIKASPSPIAAEINFLTEFLKTAAQMKEEVKQEEVAKVVEINKDATVQ